MTDSRIALGVEYDGTNYYGFQKQKTTDEFLVEKKSPLVMPPNFNELPVPNSNDQKIQKDQKNIEDLITKSDTNKNKNKKKTNKSLENLILEEIKK